MSNFERDVANTMLDKADERIRELEASLREMLVIAEWAQHETSPPFVDQDKIDVAKALLPQTETACGKKE